ncbi:MAG: 6-carboxytetrahydropterin synthase [Phycisphaerae bacterium]|nr:6-carboxytetrahydropterin synthase [Phycisphaerae bacterium]
MRFEITVTREFSAAHALRLPGGKCEPIHGHNWRVDVTVASDMLDAMGTVMDFHELERLMDDIMTPMHNGNLNELEPFRDELNPSAENVALHVGRSLELPGSVRLLKVAVWETAGCKAVYRPIS